MEESKKQRVIIQIQEKPFPVFVGALLFDDDIDDYWKNVAPFITSITFDPNTIELPEPSL